MKHTPTPWRVRIDEAEDGSARYVYLAGPGPDDTCDIARLMRGEEEIVAADARLLAAAPALLAACQEVHDYLDNLQDPDEDERRHIAVLAAAIAQAKGGSATNPRWTRELAWGAAKDAGCRAMRQAGRRAWSEEGYNVAVRELERLLPTD